MTAPFDADHARATGAAEIDAREVVDLMVDRIADGLDHPELWADFPELMHDVPWLRATIESALMAGRGNQGLLAVLRAMAMAVDGETAAALVWLEPLAIANSQSALVQGAVFHLQSLLDPDNPKYRLTGKVCDKPFTRIDVLDGAAHQCCASWVHQSAGDLSRQPWQDVWNSPEAQAVRASMFDGSYRYCNKTACHFIGANELPTREEVAARSPWWRNVVENAVTAMDRGPDIVNLAYDRTCNLACPSCRTEKYAADAQTRERFARLQEDAIMPMLEHTEVVWITGSGDTMASKNFRQLLSRLTPDRYPGLRFVLMTNGMLLTRQEWARFPALHHRVDVLRLSLDAATGPTHELLRRGARWSVMEENMAFFAELRREGHVAAFDMIFTVQVENFTEMADAIDLARKYGADHVRYYRMTNWGTFSERDYAAKAVFMPSHPRHSEFLAVMRDPRLSSPIAKLGDLSDFTDGALAVA